MDPNFPSNLSEQASLQGLQEIVRQGEASSQQLPALKSDLSWIGEKIDHLLDYLKKMLERFGWHPPEPNLNIDPESLRSALETILLLTATALALWGVYKLWVWNRSRARRRHSPEQSASTPSADRAAVSDSLGGDLSKALRARWRLMLSRRRLPVSLTPYEVQARASLLGDPMNLYEAMFQPTRKISAEELTQFDSLMRAYEEQFG